MNKIQHCCCSFTDPLKSAEIIKNILAFSPNTLNAANFQPWKQKKYKAYSTSYRYDAITKNYLSHLFLTVPVQINDDDLCSGRKSSILFLHGAWTPWRIDSVCGAVSAISSKPPASILRGGIFTPRPLMSLICGRRTLSIHKSGGTVSFPLNCGCRTLYINSEALSSLP